MANSPAVILFDSNGNAMAVVDGVAIPAGTQALLNAGSDGTKAKVLLVDANGRQILVGAGVAGTPAGGVVSVQGVASGTPIPITGAFSLPAGASTEATLATRASETTLSALNTKLQTGTIKTDGSATTQPVSGSIAVSNFPATQVVSAAALPLPAGAATAAKQPALGTAGTPATDVITVQGTASMTALKVDASATTQPVSGSVSVSNFPATQPVSVASMPLPTGAATSAKQDTGNTSLGSIDTKTPALVSGKVPVDVGTPSVSVSNFPATQPVSGSLSVANFPATQPVSAASLPLPSGASTAAKQPALGTAGTAATDVLTVQGIASMTALKVDGSGSTQPVSGSIAVSNFPATQPVSAAALPLPSGAATSAAQTTGNSSLSSIDTKVTGLALDTTLTGGSQKAILRAGAKGSTTAADVTSLAAGANHQALAVAIVDGSGNQVTSFASSSVSVSNFPATQPVSAASLPLPSGAATAAKQPALGAAGTASADVLTVQGIASMTALKVDGSASTQPVSAATLPLPSGAATSALQSTGNTSLGSIDTKVTGLALDATLTGGTQKAVLRAGAKGSTTAADVTSLAAGANHQALAVAIVDGSGNQVTSFANSSVSVSNFPATQPVSIASAVAVTDNSGSLTVDSPQLPAALVSGRLVVDGSGVTQPVSAAALPLPSGAATAALQTSGNGSLSSIDTKLTGVALDATLTGGSQKAILRAGAKGSTTAADVTSLAAGANHQALAVAIVDGSGNQVTSFTSSSVSVSNFPATQPVSASALPLPIGAATAAKQPALGAAGTASSDVLTVQGIASMTALKVDGSAVTQPVSAVALPLPSGAATSALQSTGIASLGSIDSKLSAVALDATLTGGSAKTVIRGGAKGTTVAAEVTSRPAGANSQPLEVAIVDATGNQVTSFGGSLDTSSLATSAKQPALGSAGTPSADVLSVQGVASMTPLKVDGSASTQPTTNLDTVTTGSITAVSQSVTTPDLNGQGTGMFLITGTFTGTVQFEGSVDGSAYVSVAARAVNATNTIVTIGSGGSWRFNCGGFRNFRIRASAWTSGTATITIRTSAATTGVVLTEPLPNGTNAIGAVSQSGTWTITQGASASLANGWTSRLTDGTNGPAAVKAASVAAAATDAALVVAVSPNNTVAVSAASLPLPAGASTEATVSAMNAKLPAQVSGRLPVDGSGVTQPVSGTVSVSGVALDATLTSGSAKVVARGGAKGTSTAADVTSTASGANHQALDVVIYDTAGNAITSFGSSTVSVSNFPATQPVSGSVSVSNLPATQPVSGSVSVSNFPATQPVSAASLPLPTGAATAAKQPALGTAGTAASDVLTVQGIASMTALKVDASATTQPVSIASAVAVTDNAGSLTIDSPQLPAALVSGRLSVDGSGVTQPVSASALPLPSGAATAALQSTGNSSLGSIDTKLSGVALDATLTGGSQKAILRAGAKGSTTAADVTSMAVSANHQALVVALVDALGNQLTSFGPPVSSTSNVTSVAASASSAQLLAANSGRSGATIYNDSSSVLYVKLGTTASTTSFTVKVLANGYYETPFGYFGRIDGIWATATGNARITELS